MIAPEHRYDYSPITARPAGRWPGGKKLAVYVALGVESYRFGGPHSEDLLADVSGPDLVNTSWRDYGNRVGAFRLLDRFEQLGIPPTILLNTDVYDTAPDVLLAARRSRAEIVAHGRSNSDSLAGLDPDAERAYLESVAERIAAEEGRRPAGWSSPWLTHTAQTPDLLADLGFRYLLDLRLDDQPVWLNTESGPAVNPAPNSAAEAGPAAGAGALLAIPYALELNDSSTIIGRGASASDFADMVVDEFDELLVAAQEQEQPLVMSIVVHSFICGAPFRLRQLTRALRHLGAHADDVWFTQPAGIHRAFSAMTPPPPPPPTASAPASASAAATIRPEVLDGHR